jgi:hypothetical protein
MRRIPSTETPSFHYTCKAFPFPVGYFTVKTKAARMETRKASKQFQRDRIKGRDERIGFDVNKLSGHEMRRRN